MAMIFVTHDLDLAAAACDRIAVMSEGRIVESGPAERVLNRPEHEYTQKLVAAKPSLDHPMGPGQTPTQSPRPDLVPVHAFPVHQAARHPER